MKPNLHHVLPWLACSAALLLAPSAAAQSQLAAGTPINNTATANYLPPDSTTPATSTTNTVTTLVQGQCQVIITPDGTVDKPGQSITVLPGETAVFGYTVSNTGNMKSSMALSSEFSSNNTAATIQIYDDANGNGQLDTGETTIDKADLELGQSKKVLVVVKTNATATGQIPVNLIGDCGNSKDSNNVAMVVIGEPPKLNITKTFSPTKIKPGEETTVTIVTQNGGGESREVKVVDSLLEEQSNGLEFVPGSAAATGGATVEYTADGQSWQTTMPARLMAIRARTGVMAPGARLELTFKMRATAQAENQDFVNVAHALTSSQDISSTAVLTVRYAPGVAIGPVGNPQAPEGTPADTQSKPFAVVGQEICFDHTVLNSGDVADTFTFTVTYPKGAANAKLFDSAGNPLSQVVLQPGQTSLVRVCYEANVVGGLDAQVTVNGARGTSNTTHDLVEDTQVGLPELKKISDASATDALATGSIIKYTLSVHNPYNRALNNVVVTDPLPAHTDYVAADNGGVPSGVSGAESVTWNFGTLAPGETRTVTVSAKVNDKAVDGEQIANTFHMGSKEFEKPLDSNTTNNVVWNAIIRIDKKVSSPEVAPGDAVTYTLVIHNDSPQGVLRNSVVTDTPAPGLTFIPGTATIDGQPLADPTKDGNNMNWSVGDLLPQKDITITYKMRVTPAVSGDLVNTVQVVGYAGDANKAVRKVASNRASALTRPRLLNFAPLNDIVGTVFVDRNRNGIFDKTLDTPIERARVILAGGRLSLTDKDGRYHFANVALGTQALRLDPVTTTYAPLNTPQTQGLSGTQTVFVRGLTSVDFPLAPLGGDISAIRRTSLDMGPLHLDKVVYHTDQGYVVSLKLNSSRPLEAFVLQDALPAGATLQEGSNTWNGTLPTGETTVTYRFAFSGGDEAAVTDPTATWRY